MNIRQMQYRTKTYIAADWTEDRDLIDALYSWNENENLSLHFVNVHDLTDSDDGSLNCSIKKNLRLRMNVSKTFVLIVGKKTKSLRSGACYKCAHYSAGNILIDIKPSCTKGFTVNNQSYVDYECSMALRDYNAGDLKNIIVIYNGLTEPDKSLCPDVLKNVGVHIGSDIIIDGEHKWAYGRIKEAICK